MTREKDPVLEAWRESIATASGRAVEDIKTVKELLACIPAGARETHGRCWTHSEWQKCGSLIRSVSSEPCEGVADGLDGLCQHCREFKEMCEQHDVNFMSQVTSEMQQLISHYADRGWLDVHHPASVAFNPLYTRPGYLILTSLGSRVSPLSEVQITTRCYQPFRGRKMIVGSEATRRFNLNDLKIEFRSQFRSDEPLLLRSIIGEAEPALIQWPLEICGAGGEISIRASIPVHEAGADGDLGEVFEMILLGEVMPS